MAVPDPPLHRGGVLVPGLRHRDLRHRYLRHPASRRRHPLRGHHHLVGRRPGPGLLALVPQRGNAVDPQHHDPAAGELLLGHGVRHVRAGHRPGGLHRHRPRAGLPGVGDHVRPDNPDPRRGLGAVRPRLGRGLLVRLRGHPAAGRVVRRLPRQAALAQRRRFRRGPDGPGRGGRHRRARGLSRGDPPRHPARNEPAGGSPATVNDDAWADNAVFVRVIAPRGMSREDDFYVEATLRAGADGKSRAVGVGDGADDGQAEPVSFAVADPLGAELPERLEQVLHFA